MSKTKGKTAKELLAELVEFVEWFRTSFYKLWALVTVAVVRAVYHEEATALDMELELLDVPPHQRHEIFARMRIRRTVREGKLKEPGAFERYEALAEVFLEGEALPKFPTFPGGEPLGSPPRSPLRVAAPASTQKEARHG